MARLIMATAALTCATTGAAQAQGSVSADIECLGALSFMANAEDPAAASAGVAGTLYYLGRLEGRGIDFAAELESTMRAMTPERLRETGMRCGDEISAAGDRMRVIGDDMATRDMPAN